MKTRNKQTEVKKGNIRYSYYLQLIIDILSLRQLYSKFFDVKWRLRLVQCSS